MKMMETGASRRASSLDDVRRSCRVPPGEPRLGRVLLDLLDEAVMVLDLQGRIVYCNASADEILAGRPGLTLVRGLDRQWRLCDAIVLEAVHEVTGLGCGRRPQRRVVVLPSGNGVARLVLQVCPCPPARGLSGPHVVVRLHEPCAIGTEAIDATVMRESFDLTAVEAEVALALAQGRSPAEISRQRGVSRTTTAFHLRNLFAKTGARRQPELVRVLLGHAVAAPAP